MDLDRNDQTTVIQFGSRGTDNQTWDLEPAGPNFYYLRNGMNGNALTVTGYGNGTPVQGLPFRGDENQQWRLEPGKDGNILIVSRGGKALDIPDGSNREGVQIRIFDRNGDSNQRFLFRRVNGNYRDRNRNNDSGALLTCSSDDGRRHYCNADTRAGVRMTRQISGSACIQGQTWDFDERGIWVDRGCRAEFALGGGGRRERFQNDRRPDDDRRRQ